MKTHIIAFHGWAFSAADWKVWKTLAANSSIQFDAFDRGYFYAPYMPEFLPGSSKRVIITHSWGLFMVPDTLMQQCDLLVIMNGFIELCSQRVLGKEAAVMLKRQVKAMSLSLRKAPKDLLDEFYRNSFNDPLRTCPHEAKNILLLQEDLNAMKEKSWSAEVQNHDFRTALIHSGQDAILRMPRGEVIREHFNVRFEHTFPRSSHALPFEEPERCFSLIKEWIHIFDDL